MPHSPPFRRVPADCPHLAPAHLPACACLLLERAEVEGGLGLTPGGALKRVHVTWAAEAFAWPGYRPGELYRVNKVLNEEDVFPLWLLHRVLLHTRHARHFRKAFHATKSGRALLGVPHCAFNEIVPRFLLEVDHAAMGRGSTTIPGRLGDYLNVLNLEAGDWIGIDTLTERILGPAQGSWDPRPSSLYVEVLRPLVWCGLIEENGQGSWDNSVRKTPLWPEALSLPSDEWLGRHTRPS